MANNYLASTMQATDQQMVELSQGTSMLGLSDKRVILSNPGTAFNDVYYSRINTVQSLAEVTYNTGRYQQSLSSFNFGSTSTIIIPNGSLLSTFYLHLEILPTVTDPNVSFPRGWGYAFLRQISYLMGSSNVPNISLDKHSIFQVLMGQCENAEKRSEVFHLGGEEQRGILAGVTFYADLIIPLPWSTAVGRDQKLPLPTDLLSNPITVQISFDLGSAVIGGSGVNKPLAFSQALALMRQGDMLNRDAGLRPVMYKNPSLIYGYPFIHFQSNQVAVEVTDFAQRTITWTGFINADLLGISFGIIKDTDQVTTAQNSVNPFNYQELLSLEVLFNGLTMHLSPGRMYKLTNMNSMNGASYVENSVFAPGTGPFVSNPMNTYITWIDFSRLKCEQFTGHYDNVWRVPNNTITLKFACRDGGAVGRAQIQSTFFYSGIANLRQGETTIFFD
jgi:hypothetical protein